MDQIADMLRETREATGVSIEEASADLNIKEQFILNIEDGKIGCFKDIYELKDYIISYAKYLGLDIDKITDLFNEYIFEYTSKIPIKEIEKKAKEMAKEEVVKIASPYTKKPRKYSKKYYFVIYFIIIVLIFLVIFWSIKQITIDNTITNEIGYIQN